MVKSLSSFFVLAILVMIFALPAYSQISSIDYIGYGWESGGTLKAIGDEFLFLGVVDYLDPEFGVDLGVDELTIHVFGLTIISEMDLGGTILVSYAGGYMEIYQDSSQNADWGINPPNLVAPATFSDGDLFFAGEFTDMIMFLGPDGNGTFEGNLNGVAGTMIDSSCTGCVYTWGGAFTAASGAQVPEGYTLQVDGVLEIDAAVSTDAASWGSVKALYNK